MELWLWSCRDVDTIIVFFICPPQLRPASASVGLRWSTQSQQRSSTISCHTRPGVTWLGMKDAARGWRGGPSNCCSSPAQKEYRYSITVSLPEGEKAQIRSLCHLNGFLWSFRRNLFQQWQIYFISIWITLPRKSLGSVSICMFLRESLSAHQDCIYSVKNT